MQTKKTGTTAVVTEAAAQAALRRGPARELSADEERVMRMRLGAALPRDAALERAAPPRSDLEIELLAYEIEAFLRRREAQAEASATTAVTAAPRTRAAPSAVRAAVAQPSRVKEKIVRALRKKN